MQGAARVVDLVTLLKILQSFNRTTFNEPHLTISEVWSVQVSFISQEINVVLIQTQKPCFAQFISRQVPTQVRVHEALRSFHLTHYISQRIEVLNLLTQLE